MMTMAKSAAIGKGHMPQKIVVRGTSGAAVGFMARNSSTAKIRYQILPQNAT